MNLQTQLIIWLQDLDSLLTECHMVATEIVEYIARLEVKSPSRKLESVYKAVQTVWARDKIEIFQKRLEALHSTLALRTLFVLNAKVDMQGDANLNGFDRLAHGTREIVEVMSINQAKSENYLREMTQEGNDMLESLRKNVLGAIFTLRNGDTRILAPQSQQSRHILQQPTDGNAEQTFVTVKENPEHTRGMIEVENRRHDQVQKEILDSLYFRQITDRVDEVSFAHRKTFEWVFRSSAFDSNPWDDLPAWLQAGNGCYWVNGKAGAGKSTFMKFLQEDSRTEEALLTWANGAELITTSFFFWNLGSKLQRSQVGLLRGLLFNILRAQPRIAPHILPGLYQAVVHGRDFKHTEPSFAELKKGFRNLVGLKSNELKICLFIDGLDEYEGDHAELSELFTSIPRDSTVKVLLSSRPIPACVEVFSNCQKLQLQDLTREDVRIYVTDRVSENTNFIQQLTGADGPRASALLEEIVSKASGVFLWVIIVVRAILDGLRNGDRIDELRSHLDGLPEELNELYQHMLQRLIPLYQRQASEIFQIVFRSLTLESEEPLTAMHLAHIESQDPESTLSLPVQPLLMNQRYDKACSIEMRIRSRCCGLVVVVHDYSLEAQLRVINSRITFLHRTVAEFLQNEEIRNGLLLLTSESNFEANLSLLAAYLVETKTHKADEIIDTRYDPIWRSLRACLQYGRLASKKNPIRASRFIDEIDQVMKQHWQSVKEFHAGNVTYPIVCHETLGRSHWGVSLFRTVDGIGDTAQYSQSNESMFSVAAGYGLSDYLIHKLSDNFGNMSLAQRQQATLMSLTNHARNFKINSSPRTKTSYARFLTDDADVPSENYVIITELLQKEGALKSHQQQIISFAWTYTLLLTTKLGEYSEGFWNSFAEEELLLWCKVLEMFILLGADVHTTIELGSRHGAHRQSAALVIMSVFKQLPYRATDLRPITTSKDRLRTLLEARCATKKEWVNGKLVQGREDNATTKGNVRPPINLGADFTSRKRFLGRFRLFR